MRIRFRSIYTLSKKEYSSLFLDIISPNKSNVDLILSNVDPILNLIQNNETIIMFRVIL